MPLVTCRRVKRYFANGKGYASAWHAYRGIAREQLKWETIQAVWNQKPTPRDCYWFVDGENDWDGVFHRYPQKRAGAYIVEHRKRYPRNTDWQRAIDERAKKLREADQAEVAS